MARTKFEVIGNVIASALVIIGFGGVAYGFATARLVQGSTPPCHAVDHPTGRVRCWSGGVLVYDEPAYRSGGYRCTADGAEIVTRGELCVEEWTGSADDPPGETKRMER